jgi:hypothetical protein
MRQFSVYGYWHHGRERWGEVFEATSARAAEDLAQMYAAERDSLLRVAGVLEGAVESADRYTAFLDPRDVRNVDIDWLVPDSDELEVAYWTVLGIVRDRSDHRWNDRTGGQRYCEHVLALSPMAAEDVAASKAGDEGGELLVCAVFAGRLQRADAAYAQFVNPEVLAG